MISSSCFSRYYAVIAVAVAIVAVVVSSSISSQFVAAFNVGSGNDFTSTSTRETSSFADNVGVVEHRNRRYGGHRGHRGKPPSSVSRYSSSATPTQLSMIGDLLNGIMGNNNNDGDKSGGNSESGGGGSVSIVDIPAKAVKVGPTKFYLQIYLVGEQNTPTQGSWFLKPNDESGSLDMYFGDGTAMLSIDVQADYGIKISRQGSRPSLQYMLQESVLLHGILDELEVLAFGTGDDDGKEIKAEDRLLQLDGENQADVFSKARETLPARKEEEE
eukprot:CAMPEP_0113473246 /NCGR_PEP_ID=MMETSP0014_2-20120614/17943_1 /TAXON_ID=2857 /ORGANISM="Nitzschia sp." /LENGTH=272 /DNA_ID=CAMNT_0000366003 /DNA_START=71 /DNA_END=889 /DNA_ORIENTATION=- /assembly_acc=CAM_ASM_000159